jgi:hypothetical protein
MVKCGIIFEVWAEFLNTRFACGFQNPVRLQFITKLWRRQTEVIQDHNNPNVRNVGQGEAQHRKYKKL